jgi:hypothetical protein
MLLHSSVFFRRIPHGSAIFQHRSGISSVGFTQQAWIVACKASNEDSHKTSKTTGSGSLEMIEVLSVIRLLNVRQESIRMPRSDSDRFSVRNASRLYSVMALSTRW